MGIDGVSKYSITLRSAEDLIIKRVQKDELPETTKNLHLPSVYNLLRHGELENIQSSLYKITSLDLSQCDLSELPKSVRFLHLRNLNLSRNKLRMVPLCLYGNSLDTLENLDLSHNLISHFDVAPDCVLSIKILRLDNNCFQNIPPWFLTFRCISLQELNYGENKAEHYNFLNHSCNFGNMGLRKLELKNACLVDLDLSWLKCFRNLQFLDISNKTLLRDRQYINKFKDIDQLFSKPHWKEMKILKLRYLDISFFPKDIFCIESLTELHISNNLISWFPEGIEYLVNLEVLDVSCNDLVVIPQQISQLRKLKVFLACKNQLYEISPMPPTLEVLDLYDNFLHDIKSLNVDSIMSLDLDYNLVCLKTMFSFKQYCLKRDQLRALHNVQERSCQVKRITDLYDSSQCLSDSNVSDFDTADDTDDISSYPNELEEDWDREYDNSIVFRDPSITLSDHEYNGEDELHYNNNLNTRGCFYLEDEDRIFVDAD